MAFWFHLALMAAFASLAWRVFRDNAYTLMPIASITLVLLWQGISVAYLEKGVYSPELMITTYATGATVRYFFAVCSFLLAYWLTFRRVVPQGWVVQLNAESGRTEAAARSAKLMIAVCALLIGILLWYAPRGSIDSRSKFLVENPVYLRDTLLDYLPFIALVLGFASGVARTPKVRGFAYSIFLLMLVMLVMYGNKFSAITEEFFLYCTPYVALARAYPFDRRVLGLTVKRQVLLVTAFLLVAIGIGIVKQIRYLDATHSANGGTGYLAQRVFVLQGGIFWKTDNDIVHGIYQPGLRQFAEFVKESNYHLDASLMYLMTRAIGYDLTQKIMNIDDSLFTGTFPSIFYVIGGRYGPVILCGLVGLIIGLSAGYMTRKVMRAQMLRALIAFSLFLPLVNLASAAEFTTLLSFGFLAKVVLVGLIELYQMVRALGNPERTGATA